MSRTAVTRSWRPFALTVAVFLPFVLLLTWPQLISAQRLPIVAHLIAMRVPLALGFLAVALAAGLIAVFTRSVGVAAALCGMALTAAAINGGVVIARGSVAPAPAEAKFAVLVWNTQGGATSPQTIAEIITDAAAQIVSLPEMDEQAVAAVAAGVSERSGRLFAHDTVYNDSQIPTSVMIDASIGAYERDDSAGSTPTLPSGVWRPTSGKGPVIVAVHTAPPLNRLMNEWRAGLTWVGALCDDPDVIIAGDLNATADHLYGVPGLDACTDGGASAGIGAQGTWPAGLPRTLAAPIDHVLLGSTWAATAAEVIDAPAGETDHRAVIVRVASGTRWERQ